MNDHHSLIVFLRKFRHYSITNDRATNWKEKKKLKKNKKVERKKERMKARLVTPVSPTISALLCADYQVILGDSGELQTASLNLSEIS